MHEGYGHVAVSLIKAFVSLETLSGLSGPALTSEASFGISVKDAGWQQSLIQLEVVFVPFENVPRDLDGLQ